VLTPLAPEARFFFHLQAMVWFFIFWLPAWLAAGALLVTVMPMVWTVALIGSILLSLFVVSLWFPSWAFERWGYCIREADLLIVQGVWVRRVTSIALTRIQHVDMRQGPLEQWMGLARVQIYTASGMGADGSIPGLKFEQAQRLRDLLLTFEGDDGV